MPRRLLALDLDGTLLQHDKTIHPDDVAAIRRAREAGVYVTFATGRLVGGTLVHARTVGLDGEMVCGDGATIASALDGSVIDARAVDEAHVEGLVGTLRQHGLVPFVFSHGAIHAEESARAYDDWVRIWSEQVHYHHALAETDAWRGHGTVSMTLGLGDDAAVTSAHDEVERLWGRHVVTSRFGFGERFMLRSFHPENSKGSALARLAARLGIAREACAVVGDWYNDLSMFAWAGRAFVMAGAPDDVARSATDRLRAKTGAGRGVAEAIDLLLGAP
jgi:Cof subfamily protein (haloacid dehalogenase superfamily)